MAQQKLEDYNEVLEKSIFFDHEIDPEDVAFWRTNLTTDCENDP